MMYSMPQATITPYKNTTPKFGDDVFIADGARIIGDVVVGEKSSFWFNVTVRGDVCPIRIGSCTNVQDNTVIHVTQKTGPTTIGNNVTIGHSAIIHACTVEDNCLIGMGSILLDGALIRRNSLVAAGSVVTPNKEFPEGVLIKGSPATVARPLTAEEIESIYSSSTHYIETAAAYMSSKI